MTQEEWKPFLTSTKRQDLPTDVKEFICYLEIVDEQQLPEKSKSADARTQPRLAIARLHEKRNLNATEF